MPAPTPSPTVHLLPSTLVQKPMSLLTLHTTIRPRALTVNPSSIVPSSAPAATSTGSAPPGGNSTPSAYNYFYLLLGLLACCIALLIFICYRRRRQRATLQARTTARRQDYVYGPFAEAAASRSARPPAPVLPHARQRAGAGWWRGPPREREEGLNERGEAPPAYVPKPEEEEQERRPSGGVEEAGIPLETMAPVDDVGAKPPDYYSEVREMRGEETRETDSAASASSSRGPGEQAATTSQAP